MPGRTAPECIRCGYQGADLLRCSLCQVVLYCSKAHQAADFHKHSNLCQKIHEATLEHLMAKQRWTTRVLRQSEDLTIKRIPTEIIASGSIIEGECHCTEEAREYLQAGYDLVAVWLKADTFRALQCANSIAIELLLLAPCDPLHIREMAGHIAIRLGRHQEAYDFLKFWALEDDAYDCTLDPLRPVMEVMDNDPFESFDVFRGSYMLPSTCLNIGMLKVTLLNDVKNLRNVQLLRSKLNYDCIDHIKRFITDSEILWKKQSIRKLDSVEAYDRIISSLRKDLDAIFDQVGVVDRYEPRFRRFYKIHQNQVWQCLLLDDDPDVVDFEPEDFKDQDDRDCRLVTITEKAWKETPRAREWIREKLLEADRKSGMVGLDYKSSGMVNCKSCLCRNPLLNF